jgi:hypothetical protein
LLRVMFSHRRVRQYRYRRGKPTHRARNVPWGSQTTSTISERAGKTPKLGEGGRVGLRSRDAASRCAFVLGFKHSLRSVQFCR